jgi:hypothetical protein
MELAALTREQHLDADTAGALIGYAFAAHCPERSIPISVR